jgi:hypothetical protein
MIMVGIVLNPAGRIFGGLAVKLVDATNISSMPFLVRTVDADCDKSILFFVIADPNGFNGFSLRGAELAVYDGSNLISSSSIRSEKMPANIQDANGSLAKDGVLFQLKVSTNYLNSVDFEISYVSDSMPAQMNYRFMLRTFLNPKANVGLLLGISHFKVVIKGVLPDTPAARAGLFPGLIVQQIDGHDTADMEMGAAELLRGLAGSKVQLELVNPANNGTNVVVLVRQ